MEETDIAIVEMECSVPGADGCEELWELLNNSECSIEDITDDELINSGINIKNIKDRSFVKKTGRIKDIDLFDSKYFEMTSIESDILDVQQRMMLKYSVKLLEKANVNFHDNTNNKIGVFAGSALSSYLFGVLENEEVVNNLGEMIIRHGNDKDFLATRVSYKLNLKGPSITLQTACSTGLVAVHYACQSLLLHECDSAIAGAVYIKVPQESGYIYEEGGVQSKDGVCRPFDENANGTVFTNGIGIVYLKRLNDAINDGDNVLAVIKSTAINNDGNSKVGYTAPSVEGQIDVINLALEISGVSKKDIQYIETHGTGTYLGDPIESSAIKKAYGEDGTKCILGSIKGNIGHTNIASGIIGLIKSVLILKNKIIPPTVNFYKMNKNLGLETSRFEISNKINKLDTSRRQFASVSAFGIGGTNCHAILESYEHKEKKEKLEEKNFTIFTASAKNKNSINLLLSEYKNYFTKGNSFYDTCYTSFNFRAHYSERISFVAKTNDEAIKIIENKQYNIGNNKNNDVAFIFSGQGTQNIHMGKNLYKNCEEFKNNLDEVILIFKESHNFDVFSYLWNEKKNEEINKTEIAQPLLFAIEYALAKTINSFGIRPKYLIGHSLGEIVAATFADVFNLEDAISLVMKRAKYMSLCEKGVMIAVSTIDFLKNLDSQKIWLSVNNSDRQYVLSIQDNYFNDVKEFLSKNHIYYSLLKTSHGFHSKLMQQARDNFLEFMKKIKINKPQIGIISNITGKLLTDYECMNPCYWADHIIKPVEFSKSLEKIFKYKTKTFVEIGSLNYMSNLIKENMNGEEINAFISLGEHNQEYYNFLNLLAKMWTLNFPVKLDQIITNGNKVKIPTYQFDNKKHWILPNSKFEKLVNTKEEKETQTKIKVLSNKCDSIELSMRNIFKEYLGTNDIDEKLSFFELGGNSLLAIQAITKIKKIFNVDLKISSFYDNCSVQSLSTLINNEYSKKDIEIKETNQNQTKIEDLSNSHDSIELLIKNIFKEYLGTNDIDEKLSFFELGGNSLLAIQVITKIKKIFNVDLKISSFYDNCSIEALSKLIKIDSVGENNEKN